MEVFVNRLPERDRTLEYHALDRPEWVDFVRQLLGAPGAEFARPGGLDAEALRATARSSGWSVDIISHGSVASVSMARLSEGIGARLVIVNQAVLILVPSRPGWALAMPSGRTRRVSPSSLSRWLAELLSAEEAPKLQGSRSPRDRRHAQGGLSAASGRDGLDANLPDDDLGLMDLRRLARVSRRYPTLLGVRKAGPSSPSSIVELRLTRLHVPAHGAFMWGLVRSVLGDLLWDGVGLCALVILHVPIGFALPALSATVIDAVVSGADGVGHSVWLVALVGGASATLAIFVALSVGKISRLVRMRLAERLVHKIMSARGERIDPIGRGRLMSSTVDIATIQSTLFSTVLPAVFGVASVIGGLGFLFLRLPWVALWTLGAAGAASLLVLSAVPTIRRIQDERLGSLSASRERLIERIESWKLARLLDPEGGLLSRIDDPLLRSHMTQCELARVATLVQAPVAAIALMCVGGECIYVLDIHRSGGIAFGSALAIVATSASVMATILSLAVTAPATALAAPALERLKDLFQRCEPEPYPRTSLRLPTGPATVCVEDLSYRWPSGVEAIRRLSLTLEPGERVALTGASGSGKSTLAAIVTGHLSSQCGRIVLDGVPLVDCAPFWLRRRIGLVRQEVTIVDGTFRENIMLGLGGVSSAELQEIVDDVGLEPLLRRYPRGLGQNVNGNTGEMAVGERARIGIARALVRRPGALVLDEVLGRLAQDAAEQILSALARRGTTLLVVTHHALLAKRMDREVRLAVPVPAQEIVRRARSCQMGASAV